MNRSDKGVVSRAVIAVSDGAKGSPVHDDVVVEEPLEMRVAGDALAVTMRTPGDDEHLVLGFLFAEGIISGLADIGSISHCGRPGEEGYGNVIDVSPGPGVVLDADRLSLSRRGTLTTSACGVCGRRSISDLVERIAEVPLDHSVPVDRIPLSTELLRRSQPRFERTGGLHAAAAFGAQAMVAVAEDVGRHNAVDKVLGSLLHRGSVGESSVAASPDVLSVTGRISFEIAQKAAVAGIPVLAGVSAPTSLAIDLCDRLGITLAGFVRDGRLNVYTHPERLEGLFRLEA